MRRVLVWLCEAVIRLVGGSLRMTIEDHAQVFYRADYPPVIVAFWHNRTGLNVYFSERYMSQRALYTFISVSRDGQFITDVAARFGIKALRGSSSRRGALAALAATRVARDPRADLVITPDGPRGPRCQIQPGLLRLAQVTKRPIVTITFDLAWKHELNSWDRFQVPFPFSRCKLVTRGPIIVPADATDDELAAIGAKVAQALGDG